MWVIRFPSLSLKHDWAQVLSSPPLLSSLWPPNASWHNPWTLGIAQVGEESGRFLKRQCGVSRISWLLWWTDDHWSLWVSTRLSMVSLSFFFFIFFLPIHPLPSGAISQWILVNLRKGAAFFFSSAKHYTACCITGASYVFSLFSSLPKQGELCEVHSEITSPARGRVRILSLADLGQRPFRYSNAV